MRQYPRIALKFTTALTRPGLNRMMQDLTESQEQVFLVRAEWAYVTTTAAHTSPGTDFDVDEVPEWLVAGQQVIIQSADREDAFPILSVSGSTVTVDDTTANDYPAGSKIYLAYYARLPADIQFNALTSRAWTANLRFDVNPGTGTHYFGLPSGLTKAGREIWLKKPNWRDNPQVHFVQERDEFDPGIGLVDVFAPWAVDQMQFRYGYTGLSAAQSEELIDFFKRQKGRRGSFWMPLWHDAVVVSETSLGSNDRFQVDEQDFRDAYSDNDVFKTMIVFWPDCTIETNTISSIGGASDSSVVFEQEWSQEITPDTKIYWLVRCRFDTDTLDVRWPTTEAAEMQYTLRTLPWTDDLPDTLSDEMLALNTDGLQVVTTGDVPLDTATPNYTGPLVDLYSLGITQEQIDNGDVKVWQRYAGTYQAGTPLADSDTLYTMEIRFHDSGDSGPSSYNSDLVSALGGDVVTDGPTTRGPDVEIELVPVTVPPTARWVQFRVDYVAAVTSYPQTAESKYAISRTQLMSLAGTIYC